MTIAIACVLIAGLLPIVAAGIAKFGFKDLITAIRASGWQSKLDFGREPMRRKPIPLNRSLSFLLQSQ